MTPPGSDGSSTTSWEAEFTARLAERAADMARDAERLGWWRRWSYSRLARHIWWLTAVGRTGEAHARLVNNAYLVVVPTCGPATSPVGAASDERCSCGDGICEWYHGHGWLCAECADVEVDDHGQGDGPASPWSVVVDSSWEDERCPCHLCGEPVPWHEAVLLPTASSDDLGDVTGCTIIHRRCPEAPNA